MSRYVIELLVFLVLDVLVISWIACKRIVIEWDLSVWEVGFAFSRKNRVLILSALCLSIRFVF